MIDIDTTRYRVTPDAFAGLAEISPEPTLDLEKGALKTANKALNKEIERQQELMWAEQKHRLLVVLQAIDTGGKDGTIRNVFDGVNPLGVKVASFKKPSAEEMRRDYLWRVHQHVPADGEITIFNRSHYEDVLVVKVHGYADPPTIEKRYDHINAFEKLLVDEGTTVIKIFLHISKDEQRQRLQDRLDEPDKIWKFSSADLEERKHWDAYQAVFNEMLQRTSTPWAPWYVIPANQKKFRNLVLSQILVETLRNFNMQWPSAEPGLKKIKIPK